MHIRAAVIGVGKMGLNHARTYASMPNVKLVGVMDANPVVAESVARATSTQPYINYNRLIAEQHPDIISLVTPATTHFDIAVAVISQGVHLLVEKPMAVSAEQARVMISYAKKCNKKLMIAHIERFNPVVTSLQVHLRNGDFGPLRYINAIRKTKFPQRIRDVGVALDLAIHDIDLIHHLTGSKVIRLFAETERLVRFDHEDMLSATLRLEDGTIVNLQSTWLSHDKTSTITIIGEHMSAHADLLNKDIHYYRPLSLLQKLHETNDQLFRDGNQRNTGDKSHQAKDQLRSEIEAFITAVVEDTAPPVTGTDALNALIVAQAIISSGLDHKVLDLTHY